MSTVQEFQMPLFGSLDTNHITNVASVPQRSPFRYPGGKTWLVPFVRQWLTGKSSRPTEFIEPFAGGAIIGLTVAFERLADHITLVELDKDVASVWNTIIYGDYERLANRIATFDLTPESANEILFTSANVEEEKAFQTILKNRINRGGILAPGAGKIKNGENGKGIKSRWYPDTLRKRILEIGKIRDRLTFVMDDGLKILQQNTSRSDVACFIDPPYTADGKKAGSRLYTHFELDHELLFKIACDLQGDFLMTYDNAPGVKQLADKYGFSTDLVAMKNTHHVEMSELLISKNLNWLRQEIQPIPATVDTI